MNLLINFISISKEEVGVLDSQLISEYPRVTRRVMTGVILVFRTKDRQYVLSCHFPVCSLCKLNHVAVTGHCLLSQVLDPPYLHYSDINYLSNEAVINPLSWDWNTIYVRYCDGASFSGNNESEILTENGDPLYFKGFKNLNAVLDVLRDEYALLDATDVLLTGSSAGGLAVYLHSDYIASYIGAKENGINFMAMADSGWFMDYEGNSHYADCMRWIFEAQNTSIGLNQKCIESKGEDGYQCMFAQHTAPFIESKLMAIQSRYDSEQIKSELISDDESEINAYGQRLEESMMAEFVESKERMLYLDSCQHHCYRQEWKNIVIDGYNASAVQYAFWFNNTCGRDTFIQNNSYPCKECCNASQAKEKKRTDREKEF